MCYAQSARPSARDDLERAHAPADLQRVARGAAAAGVGGQARGPSDGAEGRVIEAKVGDAPADGQVDAGGEGPAQAEVTHAPGDADRDGAAGGGQIEAGMAHTAA